ncbi:CCA tRNA nucleotidyltransferase, partial [Nonlabens mediterrranea]|nr:CCA tRNA nucleotidyltransferase [Nonlabens mediterrranea]
MEQLQFKDAISHPVFKTISDAAAAIGVEAYVIGGFVRDYFLKRGAKQDIDIVAVGSGIELAQKVAALLPQSTKVSVFKTYGTAMVKTDDFELEFVGARKESYTRDSRNPIVEDGTLEDDQNRRDFTINAMAFSLSSQNYGQLVDPFNGMVDLEKKIIKTPLEPNVTYSDDPLRMMRAIRFAAQLNFRIEDTSFHSIKNNASRIKIITNERIITELNKIMMCDGSSHIIILFNSVMIRSFV